MNWQEICDNPLFQNLPFKLETNRWGQIVMSPATNQHGLYQARMIRWLAKLLEGGEPLVECSIQTAEGVKGKLTNSRLTPRFPLSIEVSYQ